MPKIFVTFKKNQDIIREEEVDAEEVPEMDRTVTTHQGEVVPVARIVYEAYLNEGRIFGGQTTFYNAEGEVLNVRTMTTAPPPPRDH